MNQSAIIQWRGLKLSVSYSNEKEFHPCHIVAVDENGEEGPYSDNLLHFLTIDAVVEIGELVKESGKSDALDSIMNRHEWEDHFRMLG